MEFPGSLSAGYRNSRKMKNKGIFENKKQKIPKRMIVFALFGWQRLHSKPWETWKSPGKWLWKALEFYKLKRVRNPLINSCSTLEERKSNFIIYKAPIYSFVIVKEVSNLLHLTLTDL